MSGDRKALVAAGAIPRTYHMAHKVNDAGDVSALCFKAPRAIDLKRSCWTNRPQAVTCQKCLRALASAAPGGGA